MNMKKLIKYVSFTFILLFGLVFNVKAETYKDVATKEELIQAVANGENIKLTNDITNNEELIINNSISIDLNGYTYTTTESSSSTGIKITGTDTKVTINDSVGTGKITNTLTTKNSKTIYLDEKTTLELNSGNILTDTTRIGYIINLGKNSTFIMNGGVIKNNKDIASVAVAVGGANGKVIMHGGEIVNDAGTAVSLGYTSTFFQMVAGRVVGKQAIGTNGELEITGGEIIGTASSITHTGNGEQRVVIRNVAINGAVTIKPSDKIEIDNITLNGKSHNKIDYISNDKYATKSVIATNAETLNSALFLAVPGDTVTVSITPKTKEQLLDFQVLDSNGNKIEFSNLEVIDGIYKYTFTMPNGNVTLKSQYKTHKIIQKLSEGVISNMPEVVEVGYNAVTRFEYTVENGYALVYIRRDGIDSMAQSKAKSARATVQNQLAVGKVEDDTEIEVMAVRIDHAITSGNNTVLTEGKSDNLEIVVDTTQAIVKIKVNSIELDPTNYTVDGNKVTISKDYINTLPSGTYSVEITYDDNSISVAQFEVKKTEKSADVEIVEKSKDVIKEEVKNPKTGDNILIYLIAGLSSIVAITFSVRKLKKS